MYFSPEIHKLIVRFSKKCHAELLHRIFSLRGISNLRQENTLVSQHLADPTHLSMCFSPSSLAADTGKDINPVSEGAAAFENGRQSRNTNKVSTDIVTSAIPNTVRAPNAQTFSCSNGANLLHAVFPPRAQNTCIVRSPPTNKKPQALLMSSWSLDFRFERGEVGLFDGWTSVYTNYCNFDFEHYLKALIFWRQPSHLIKHIQGRQNTHVLLFHCLSWAYRWGRWKH